AQQALRPALDDLPPQRLRQWVRDLGIDTFVGSSMRVFPTDMKAAPLLRAWLQRLRGLGVAFCPRHRWLGWPDDDPARGWRFDTRTGEQVRRFDAVVLALGGGSWPRLGSDGGWCETLRQADVVVEPLQPANCGFELPWSDHIRKHFAGVPIKHIALSLTDDKGRVWRRKGEFVVSDYGIEGSLVYALSAPLRELLADASGSSGWPGSARHGSGNPPTLWLDWLPEIGVEDIEARLRQPRKGMSFANVLRKKLRLPAVASALLRECCPPMGGTTDAGSVARALKAMPLKPTAPRPIAEAISSAGGVGFDAVDSDLMLNSLPGVFVAGEMLDWEAPTGGYLLTACFATGKRAGEGVVRFLSTDPNLQ
ncbi:MAG: TIGR03862 family flavoprotein, partial [Bacteroidales bacterium]|nr:TIGR03862 family flavoprotein [Bacteroidales bacterium]